MARREDLSTLGGRMKAAARRAGKNAVMIAEEIGVDVISVRRWGAAGTGTKNARNPSANNLAAYARATGTTVEELLGDTAWRDRFLLDRMVELADALMSGASASEALEKVTEPGYAAGEQRARLDVATELFRAALTQALGGRDWSTATADERRRAVRLLESLLDRPEEGRSGGTSPRVQ